MDSTAPARKMLEVPEAEPAMQTRCVDLDGEEARLGGVVRYTAHLCLAERAHGIDGVVTQVAITVDRWPQPPLVQRAMLVPEFADQLREDLARAAVRTHLLRETQVSWRRCRLD